MKNLKHYNQFSLDIKNKVNEMKFPNDDYANTIWDVFKNDILGLIKKINVNHFDGQTEEIIAESLSRIYHELQFQKNAKKYQKQLGESVNEAMAFKKAYKLTKKLNDDALLKDLIYVANKIHDKMGTSDEVNDWLKQVITYGNKQTNMWKE